MAKRNLRQRRVLVIKKWFFLEQATYGSISKLIENLEKPKANWTSIPYSTKKNFVLGTLKEMESKLKSHKIAYIKEWAKRVANKNKESKVRFLEKVKLAYGDKKDEEDYKQYRFIHDAKGLYIKFIKDIDEGEFSYRNIEIKEELASLKEKKNPSKEKLEDAQKKAEEAQKEVSKEEKKLDEFIFNELRNLLLGKKYYAALSIPKDAKINDIKRAYRKISLKLHPDTNKKCANEKKAQCDEMFSLLAEAYQLLLYAGGDETFLDKERQTCQEVRRDLIEKLNDTPISEIKERQNLRDALNSENCDRAIRNKKLELNGRVHSIKNEFSTETKHRQKKEDKYKQNIKKKQEAQKEADKTVKDAQEEYSGHVSQINALTSELRKIMQTAANQFVQSQALISRKDGLSDRNIDVIFSKGFIQYGGFQSSIGAVELNIPTCSYRRSNNIPKNLHYFWFPNCRKGNNLCFNIKFDLIKESLISNTQDTSEWSHYLWTHKFVKDIPASIVSELNNKNIELKSLKKDLKFSPLGFEWDLLEAAKGRNVPADLKINIRRYLILHKYGGIWVELGKILNAETLEQFMCQYEYFFVAKKNEANGKLEETLLAASEDNQFIDLVLKYLHKDILKHQSDVTFPKDYHVEFFCSNINVNRVDFDTEKVLIPVGQNENSIQEETICVAGEYLEGSI